MPFSKTAEATRLIEHPQRKIHLGAERREMFMTQVRKDVGFLERHSIIDYRCVHFAGFLCDAIDTRPATP